MTAVAEAPALPRLLSPADLQWVMGVSESTVTEWSDEEEAGHGRKAA